MNKSSHWLVGFSIVSTLVSIAMAFLLFKLFSVSTEMPPTERGYTIEALALQITVLEMVIGLAFATLGIIGFLGYGGIKSAAIGKAEEAAKRIAENQMADFINQQAVSAAIERASKGDAAPYEQQPDTSPQPPSGSTKVGELE